MKKVLLASTALALTAGMAAADVSLSGYAEIGVKDNGDEVVFHHDFDVKFTLSGETDGGWRLALRSTSTKCRAASLFGNGSALGLRLGRLRHDHHG